MTPEQIAIYGQAVLISNADANGAVCATFTGVKPELFNGNKADALVFLGCLSRGESVEVIQHDANGEFIRNRSCMNKAALWADIDQNWGDL